MFLCYNGPISWHVSLNIQISLRENTAPKQKNMLNTVYWFSSINSSMFLFLERLPVWSKNTGNKKTKGMRRRGRKRRGVREVRKIWRLRVILLWVILRFKAEGGAGMLRGGGQRGTERRRKGWRGGRACYIMTAAPLPPFLLPLVLIQSEWVHARLSRLGRDANSQRVTCAHSERNILFPRLHTQPGMRKMFAGREIHYKTQTPAHSGDDYHDERSLKYVQYVHSKTQRL